MRTTLLAIVTLSVLAAPAAAQESTRTGVGVGAEALLLTPPGAAVSYDAASWRLDGMLGFYENTGGDQILIGARVLFPLHTSDGADFSLGGGLGIINREAGGGDNETDIHLEGDAQIRAFITSNVAVITTLGVAVAVTDGDDPFVVTGDLLGSVGVLYYFY